MKTLSEQQDDFEQALVKVMPLILDANLPVNVAFKSYADLLDWAERALHFLKSLQKLDEGLSHFVVCLPGDEGQTLAKLIAELEGK